MEINYNITGTQRKALATAVSEITGEERLYLGAPTFNYQVGGFTITQSGTLIYSDSEDSNVIEDLIEKLRERGFDAEAAAEDYSLDFEVPRDSVNIENLKSLVEAKGNLIKKALDVSDLEIKVNEDTVSFPWFTDLQAEDAPVYTTFISKICKMSKDATRVTAKPRDVENEKYAFRCFLLRLGYIGKEYKTDRKVLLRNFTGSSAFKNGQRRERQDDVETLAAAAQ